MHAMHAILLVAVLLMLSCDGDKNPVADPSPAGKITTEEQINPPRDVTPTFFYDSDGNYDAVRINWRQPSYHAGFANKYVVAFRRASASDWTFYDATGISYRIGLSGSRDSYEYQVKAVAISGYADSEWAQPVVAEQSSSTEDGSSSTTPPSTSTQIMAPADLDEAIRIADSPSVTLHWNRPTDNVEEGHNFNHDVRYKRAGGSYTQVSVDGSQLFYDISVDLGVRYEWGVRSQAEAGYLDSDWSSSSFTLNSDGADWYVFAGDNTLQVDRPTRLRSDALTSSVMQLTWWPPQDRAGFGGSYLLEYKTDAQTWDAPQGSASPTATEFVISDIVPNISYQFRVKAVANSGHVDSEWNTSSFGTTYQDNPATAATDYDLSNLPLGIPVESTGRGNEVTIDAVNTGLRRASCGDRDYWQGICNSSDYQAYVDGGFIDSDMCSLINLCDQGFDTFMRISPTSLWEQEYIATPNDPKSDWVRWPSNTDDPRYFVWEYVGTSRSSKVFNPDALGLEPIPGHDNLFRLKGEVRIETVRGGNDEAGYVIFNDTSRRRSEVQTLSYGDRVVSDRSRDSNDPDVIESPGDGVHNEVVENSALKRAYDAACSGGSRSEDCNSFCQARIAGNPGYCGSRQARGCNYDSNQDVVRWSDTCEGIPEDHVSNTETGVTEQCTAGISYSCPHGEKWTVVNLDGEMVCSSSPQPGRTYWKFDSESECTGTYIPRWVCTENGHTGFVYSVEECSGTTEPAASCQKTKPTECTGDPPGRLHSSGVCTMPARAENSCN